MKILIEKELGHPETINGYAEIVGPFYHLYAIDDEGSKTFIKTVVRDIKEAAREAEWAMDIDLLEVAYKENPDSFKSCVELPPNYKLLENAVEAQDWDKLRVEIWNNELKKKEVLNAEDIISGKIFEN